MESAKSEKAAWRGPLISYGLALLLLLLLSYWQQHSDQRQRGLLFLHQDQVSTITGVIQARPRRLPYGASFSFAVQRWNGQAFHRQMWVQWYGKYLPAIQVGQGWRLKVGLRQMHHLNNRVHPRHTTLDFQWRVLKHSKADRLPALDQRAPLAHWRDRLSHWMQTQIKDPQAAAFFQALCLGIRDGMPHRMLWVFQKTGTSHLIAISGLHIALMAFLAYQIFFRVLRYWVQQYIPRQHLAWILAAVCAWLYADLSGFAMTTQRASWMLLFFLLARLLTRRVSLWAALLFAIWMLMCCHPNLHWGPSISLSVMAVFFIGFLSQFRLRPMRGWRDGLTLQWRLSFLLMPLVCYFFSYVSTVEILSNTMAIPCVELLLAPLGLLACVLHVVSNTLASLLLHMAVMVFKVLWYGLQHLSSWPNAIWVHPIHHLYLLVLALVGALLMLSGLGWDFLMLGVLMQLPFYCYHPAKPAVGRVWLSVLDVGQGLATLIQTAHHQMVYDAGPRYLSGVDMGDRVVVPSVLWRGLHHLDMMMISHGDIDHRGGANAVLAFYPHTPVYSSATWYFKSAQHCVRGQHWQWDGVHFEVLSPDAGEPYRGNNSSCVLRVWTAQQQLLLTGDMGFKIEHRLLRRDKNKLPSTVLVVPHHGSCYASCQAFVEAVHPQYALVSSGFHNAYHMPCPAVVSRYQSLNTRVLNTADTGEIDLH